jgi:hypothetical protein
MQFTLYFFIVMIQFSSSFFHIERAISIRLLTTNFFAKKPKSGMQKQVIKIAPEFSRSVYWLNDCLSKI